MSWAPPLPPRGFFDAASGEPLHPAARAALDRALGESWADPSRLHHQGRRAALFLAAAREEVAAALDVPIGSVTFTSSGSAALALAVDRESAGEASTAVTSTVEHSAVTRALAGWRGPVHEVAVDHSGRVDVAELWSAAASASLIVLAAANHEVGTRQPLAEISAELPGVPLLVDAAAGLAQDPTPTGWTMLAASARKWGGPAGIGLLVDRRRNDRSAFADGLVDVPAAVAAAASLTAVLADREEQDRHRRELVDRLRSEIRRRIPDVELVGDPTERLPHILNFSCLYVDGEALVSELDRAGFAVNSGSACASAAGQPSHVLAAMGVLTHGNVRVSLPRGVAAADVDAFIAALPPIVEAVRTRLPG